MAAEPTITEEKTTEIKEQENISNTIERNDAIIQEFGSFPYLTFI